MELHFLFFFLKMLNSDPRSEMLSSVVVGDICIDSTIKEASAATILVNEFLQKSIREPYKSRLKECNTTCHTLVDNMRQAKILWGEQNILETKNIARRSARALSETCHHEVERQQGGLLNGKITNLVRTFNIIDAVCELFELMIPIDIMVK